MSVRSEFVRLVGDCRALLETSEAHSADRWIGELCAALALADKDLPGAAERVLAMGRRSPSLAEVDFPTPAAKGEFVARCDHLLALVRVILGRPPAGSEGA